MSEGVPHLGRNAGEDFPGDVKLLPKQQEAVIDTGDTLQAHPVPGLRQCPGIRLAAVPKRVTLGIDGIGSGQTREVLGPDGVQVGVLQISGPLVRGAHAAHEGFGENGIAVDELLPGGVAGRVRKLAAAVAEHLQGDLGAVPVPGQGADGGAEESSGAVARQGDAAAVQPQVRGVVPEPGQSGVAILHRGGEGILRRQAVAHTEDGTAAVQGQLPAEGVVARDVVDAEAAAVVVDQHRQAPLRRGAVEPQGKLPPGAGDGEILRRVDGGKVGRVVVDPVRVGPESLGLFGKNKNAGIYQLVFAGMS